MQLQSESIVQESESKIEIGIFLFHDFESLDIFGPIEVFGHITEYHLNYCSLRGGLAASAQGASVLTQPIDEIPPPAIFVIPGGMGTRQLVNDAAALDAIRKRVEKSTYCLSICTGSAVLARCGVLNGRWATSNKHALEWVKSMGTKVAWLEKARWCVDGKFYTSSGVSAGIDMALGFVADRFGRERAEAVAHSMEYVWNSNPDDDPFAFPEVE